VPPRSDFRATIQRQVGSAAQRFERARSPGFRGRAIPLATLVAALLATVAAAETPRAELGKRLRRFELAWQQADAQRRAAAVAPMKAAVNSFFTLQPAVAAARLDDAWLVVRGEGPADVRERQAIATAVTVTPLFADTTCDVVTVSFERLYPGPDGEDPEARLRIVIEDAEGMTLASRDGAWGEATGSLAWTTGPLPRGDHRFVVQRVTDDAALVVASLGLSRAERLDERLTALRDPRAPPAHSPSPTGRATIAAIADVLGNLAASRGQETDYPATRLLSFAEELRASGNAAGESIAAEARRADCWLTLSDGRREVPVRLRAPADAAGPLPVLFLLHGAGGSENMFFDACGAGRAVTLGIRRGWLVVAPRHGFFGLPLGIGPMLELLEDAFKIDRSRVFVAGHSMGAAQTATQAALHPRLVAAAAALGGGGKAPANAEAGRIPWFVAAGAEDFGRPAASALAKNLRAAGNTVAERVIPDVEHMVVVQAALDDLFAFLDTVAADAGPAPWSAP